jgi:hypothetical protein
MGVAMAVPGYRGGANFRSWLAAGLFEDFEIWACAVHFAHGDITLGDRMAETATNIADAIRAGKAPTPDVLFGFSAAGYMAWLVDHILGGERRQIIINDAAPVHRVGYRQTHTTFAAQNQKLIGISEGPFRPGKVLLIRRAASDRFTIPGNDRTIWKEGEGLSVTIEVTALDHMEMDEPEIYSLVRPYVRAFNDGTELTKNVKIDQTLTFGGRVSSLLENKNPFDYILMQNLMNGPLDVRWRVALGGLLYLALRHSEAISALSYIRSVNEKTVHFRNFTYAEFMMKRSNKNLHTKNKFDHRIPALASQHSVNVALGLNNPNYLKQMIRKCEFTVYLLCNGAIRKRHIIRSIARFFSRKFSFKK